MGSQKIAARLTVEGKKRNLTSPRATFLALYEVEGRSLREVAELLGVSKQDVAYWLRRMSISIRPQGRDSVFEQSIAKLGFAAADDYFKARQDKTFDQMAEEVGVATPTIRRHHEAYVQRFVDSK